MNADFFDDNNYTHDPRTQFMAWGVMYNGAWDYPISTRGYDLVHRVPTHPRGPFATESLANGSVFDRRFFRDHGQVWDAGTALLAPNE